LNKNMSKSGTKYIVPRNKNNASEEHISSTWGTKLFHMRNKSHLLWEPKLWSEEHILPTWGTKNIAQRNTSRLCWNKNIASEEEISSTRGTRILSWRNIYCLLEEQKYCRGTHFVYLGNNNLVSEEHISSTWGTRILCRRNNSSHTKRTKKVTTVE
jgi:hypothetical protein